MDDLRVQEADEGEVAVFLAVIQTVAYDKFVGNGEADVVGGDVFEAAGRLVEEDADFEAAGLEGEQFGLDAGKGPTGVKNIVNEQHVPPAHVEPQFRGEDQPARLGAAAVA